MKKYIYILLLLILIQVTALSQATNELRGRYGLYGHFTLNLHNPAFSKLPGIPNCCPEFDDGFGTGVAFGLLYERPFAKNLLFGLRAGYSVLDGELSKTEKTMMFSYGERIEGEFEHVIDARISNIGIDAYLGYQVINRLFIYGGVRLGFAISGEFDQSETIINPANAATFIDSLGFDTHSRVRNERSEDIPGASSMHLFLLGGIAYELPLNRDATWILAPELFYHHGLSNMADEVDWTVNTINIGLALKWSPRKRRGPVKGKLYADINAYGLDKNGDESSIVNMTIEEFSSMELHPLLTYVFFDKNSSTIPDRYRNLSQEQKNAFTEEALYKEKTLDIYYQMLNVIGKRMTDNPGEKITIVGCNDNEGAENKNERLSRKRARAVRDYLTNTWGINDNRMKLEFRNLPKVASNIKEADGLQENRRVEILSDSWAIIKPVICYDTIRVSNPPALRFYPEIFTDDGIKSWTINAEQDSRLLKEIKGNGMPGEKHDWKFSGDEPVYADDLYYSLTCENVKGETATSDIKSIPVEVITLKRKKNEGLRDRQVQKFSLILFEFNKSTLGSTNKRIVDLIKERISPGSKVTITGHTDRLGDNFSNKTLSDRRAKSVKRAMGHPNSVTNGKGEENLLYNNDLPEGRFYCRTVNVVVETIVE